MSLPVDRQSLYQYFNLTPGTEMRSYNKLLNLDNNSSHRTVRARPCIRFSCSSILHLFATIIIYLILLSAQALLAAETKRVLYISSYHPEFPTFSQQVTGIKSILDTENIYLDIEFMDTKRFPGRENLERFNSLLTLKLSRLPKYDAVIVADDAALLYAIREEDRLFRGIPVFFCGINNITLAEKLGKENRMKGVIEAVSVKDTLDLVHHIFPVRNHLNIITDSTIAGQADLRTLILITQGMPFKVKVLSLETMTFDGLNRSLEGLSDKDVILLLSSYTDRDRVTRNFHHELKEIVSHSRVPVFHLWEHGLGDGIFGGKLISHEDQGRETARLVMQYFNGTPVKDIKNIEMSPNRYKFDYRQLKRFNISESSLPDDSIIINRPPKFYEEHRVIIISSLVIILLLSNSIIILLWNRRHLKKIVEERTAELIDREIKLKMAIDNAKQITWEWDSESNTITISRDPDVSDDIENTEVRIKWDDFINTLHPDDVKRTKELLKKHFKGILPIYDNIHRRISPDGSVKWLLARGKVIRRDSEGKAVKITGISTDITYIKQIEEELRESQKMLRLILDTIPLGVFWKDINHRYRGCNNVFAREMGLSSPDEIINKTDMDLIYSSQADTLMASDNDVFKTGKPKINYEDEMILPSGIKKMQRKSKIPLTDDSGTLTGLLGTFEDITEQKKLAEEIFRMQKLESVGILAAGIAHDFNNILMGISGAISVIKISKDLSEKNMSWLDRAEFLCNTASELTSRLITFSKGGKPVFEVIDLPEIIRSASKHIQAGSDITLSIDKDLSPAKIHGDERQLKQVVRNIIMNSVEAMPAGGTISITSSTQIFSPDNEFNLNKGVYAEIIIRDTGTGILPENLNRVFDPYFTTKSMGVIKGQGLGLPICHSIIKNHYGTINISSAAGKGTAVTIHLPVGINSDNQQKPSENNN